MKFFLGQMEMSREAVHVGTLALIRAVVSAMVSAPPQGDRAGPRVAGVRRLWPFPLNCLAAPCAACGT